MSKTRATIEVAWYNEHNPPHSRWSKVHAAVKRPLKRSTRGSKTLCGKKVGTDAEWGHYGLDVSCLICKHLASKDAE